MLLDTELEPRKDSFIQDHAEAVENLDI